MNDYNTSHQYSANSCEISNSSDDCSSTPNLC